MNQLIARIKQVFDPTKDLPFTVYNSSSAQHLRNVPIARPTLIVVLGGDKRLGGEHEVHCSTGQFIFMAENPAINMRNIPSHEDYFALIIEFESDDFYGITRHSQTADKEYFIGDVGGALQSCLYQFVDSVDWAPGNLWSRRKQEILQMLIHLGFTDTALMQGGKKLSQQLHDYFVEHSFNDVTASNISQHLAMSESTLRRRLMDEGTSLQDVKDRARLGRGLHLLQASDLSIGLISERCGYHSQSRFTDRFKNHFGITPTALRKTRGL